MTERHAAFVGTVPSNYDRHLGPILFHRYADDLAARLQVSDGMRVLEVACGTGIVTERLLRRLGGRGTLVATDLNDAMLAYAEARIPGAPRSSGARRTGRACPSPTAPSMRWCASSGSCSSRTRRPACGRPTGSFGPAGRTFSTCGTPSSGTPSSASPTRPSPRSSRATRPGSTRCPSTSTTRWQCGACWRPRASPEIRRESVETIGESPTAEDAARGLVEGNPVIGTIMERRPEALADIEGAVARNLAAELGDRPVRCPLRAHVFTARRPEA